MTNAEQPNSRLEDRNHQDPWTATAGQSDGPLSNPIGKSSLGGHALKFTAVLAVIALAVWVVSKKLKDVTWGQIQEGFDNLPREHILIALGLMVLNYLVLTGYDWIAIRFMKKELSTPRLMAGAIVGYAFGNVLGWLFGGNLARYRMYSRWGFTLLEIVGLVSILSITFWLGLFLLAGISFIALPIQLPPELTEHLDFESKLWGKFSLDQHLLGWVLLGCVMLYLGACVVIRKPIHFKGMTISLPPFHLSAMQLIVSALDFLLASATLYVLLPPDIVGPDKINFSTALIAYLSAQIVAVITHAPGAVGILEGILLTFLEGPSGNKKGSIISALIMFRVIYYFIPFLVAGLIMLVHEYWPRSNKETGDLSDGI